MSFCRVPLPLLVCHFGVIFKSRLHQSRDEIFLGKIRRHQIKGFLSCVEQCTESKHGFFFPQRKAKVLPLKLFQGPQFLAANLQEEIECGNHHMLEKFIATEAARDVCGAHAIYLPRAEYLRA